MKKRILYIARNIPTPKQSNNQVILNIAEKLSSTYDLDIYYPNEIVPWGLHFLPKYKPLYNLKPWKFNDQTIRVIKYVRLPINSSAFLFANKSAPLQQTAFKNYDLTHGHYIFPDGILAYEISHKWNIPFVVTVRESDLILLRKVSKKSSTWQWAEKVLNQAKTIHVLNRAALNYLKEHFKIDGILIPHGISASNISQSKIIKEKTAPVEISVVGDAITTKQINWVINAVKEYNGNQKVKLTIIGDGSELDRLKKLAAGNNNIQLLGRVPHQEVFEHLRRSDIFALPSYKETFGLVYLEAAANHNAIIGFYNVGIYGVLEEGKEVFCIKDYDEFKSKLFQLIDDKDLRERMSQSAFGKAKNLTWEKIIQRYSEVYEKVIED